MLIRLSRIFSFFFVTGILGIIGFRIYSEKFASKEKIPNNVKIYLITDSVRYKADDIYWNARASIEKGNWRNVYLAIHHLDRLIASTGYDDAKIYRTALQGSVLAMKGNYIKALDCHLEVLDFVKDKNYFAHMLYGYRELIKICKILKMPEEVKKYEHAQKLLLFQTQVPPLETIRLKDSVERCRDTNPYMAAIVAKELFYTSRNRGDLQGMGRAYMTLGYILDSYKPEALQNYKKALAIYTHLKFYEGMADCYLSMGVLYHLTELYDLSLEYNQKALLYYTRSNSNFKKAKSYHNLALAYNSKEEYNDAEKNELDALAIMQNLKEEKWVAGIYNQLGIISENQKKYDQALMYYTMAMAINQKIGYKEGLANVYNNMAEIHKEVYLNFDEAMNCYKKSIAIEKKLNNEKGIAITLYNIGLTQSTLHQYQEALTYFNQSQVLAEKVGDKKQLELLAKEFVKVHQQLGNASKASMYSNKYSALNKFNNNEELKEMLEKYDQKCELRENETRFRLLRQEKELFKKQAGEVIKN